MSRFFRYGQDRSLTRYVCVLCYLNMKFFAGKVVVVWFGRITYIGF